MQTLPIFPILFAAMAGLVLSGCAGAPETDTPPRSCSCTKYYAAKPRPAWVDRSDHVTATAYQSTGLAACTGVQSLDTEKADLSARSKLSRVVSARSDIRISETRSDVGSGVGYAEASISATQISQTVLEGSRIFARWVDPTSCTVYAGVEMPMAALEAAKAEAERKEAARLVNQAFFISAEGPNAALLSGAAAQMLSAAGVSRIAETRSAATHVAALSFETLETGATLIRGRLTLRLTAADGTLIWSRTAAAKGLSYRNVSVAVLTERAIADGLDLMSGPLTERLQN